MTCMAFSWEPFGPARDDEPVRPARTLPNRPARGLAVLTCMDSRIDPLAALHLALGDAVILRNAGAQASDDMLNSLRLAHRMLGVTEVQVVAHTDCAAHNGDDRAAVAAAERAAARVRSAVPGLRAEPALLDLRTGKVSRRAGARPPSD
jgi:carbonic anhydrase